MNRTVLCFAIALAAGSCARTPFVNPAYRRHLSSQDDKLLFLPVEAHGFKETFRAPLETLATKELHDAFAAHIISAKPVKDALPGAGLGNIGWQLAAGMARRVGVDHKNNLKGTYYDWMEELYQRSMRLTKWAKTALMEAGALVTQQSELRYVLVGYVERLRLRDDGKSLTFRVIGGIYDAREGRVVACAWYHKKAENKLETIRQVLSGMGKRLFDDLSPVLMR